MKYIFTLTLIIFSLVLNGQNRIEDLLNSEIEILDRTFNDAMFLELCKKGCNTSRFYKIEMVDTIHLLLLDKKGALITTSTDLIKVQIKLLEKLSNLGYQNGQDTYEFYLIQHGSDLFRLFGFYQSDINLFYSRIGSEGIKSLSENLIKNGIINKKEGSYFVSALIKEDTEYSQKLNKPCSLLFPYFKFQNMEKANTKILPLKPLQPFAIE